LKISCLIDWNDCKELHCNMNYESWGCNFWISNEAKSMHMEYTLEKILSFATKKSMTKCPKQLIIEYNNRILLQILCVKNYSHTLVVHLTSRWWRDHRKVDVVFSLHIFIHMAFTIDDKMMCHYIHNVIIKLFCNDSKMISIINSQIRNYDM